MSDVVQPKISVVMPSYNQAKFLEEAVCSVLEQAYPNKELLVLDGGSTDDSQTVIQRYADHLAFWRSGPDQGQTDALIQGFERATGDLLGWVNSDDVLLPGCLERIAETYIKNPQAGLFGGNYVLIDTASRIIRCKRHPGNARWFAQKFGVFVFNQPGSFFKRQDYEAVNGLNRDLHYVMDNDLYVRMMFQGTRFAHTGSYLAGFRKHEQAKTVAYVEKTQQEYQQVRQNLWPKGYADLRRVWLGTLLVRAWQTLNGNYLRMTLESLPARGQHWKTWCGEQAR